MEKDFSWTAFNKARSNNPPRETLMYALKRFTRDERSNLSAFDIGCGPGNDTAEILSKGWKVIATDSNPDILKYLSPLLQKYKNKLEVQITSFEDIIWHKTDLVNASYTLPFCPEKHFAGLWKNIVSNINTNGRFSGQFFGKKDEWKELTRHSKKEVLELFDKFEIEMIDEMEKDDATASGNIKHWHIYNIVARKK